MTPGDVAWCGLFAYVVAYDSWAYRHGRDSMSQSYARALDDPLRRPATLAATVYVFSHLTHALPHRFDPLRRIFR